MELFQVSYEENDMWFTAGFTFAPNGSEAIDLVRIASLGEICKKTGRDGDEVMNEMNFDYLEVITINQEKVIKV